MSESDLGRVTDVFEQFVRDLGLYAVARVVPAILSVVTLVVFTRAFPPSAYGRYALTLSIATILGTVCYGWIDQAIVRFEPHIEPSLLIGNVSWLIVSIGVGLGILSVLVRVIVAPVLGPFEPFVFAGAAVAITQGTYYVLRALLRVRLQSRSVLRYELIQSVGGVAFALVLVFVVLNDIVGWLWGTAIASGATALVLAVQLGFRTDSINIDAAFANRMARYGFPLIGWLVGLTALNFADQILIQLLRGSEATGIYASNYSVVLYGLGLVFTPFVTAAEPILMNLWNDDNDAELAAVITDITRYLLLVGVPGVIGLSALNRVVSGLLLDTSYLAGSIIIPFVAAGLLCWNAAVIGQKAIEIEERTIVLFVGVAMTVVVNVITNVPLIMRFGYVGAAIATFVSFLLYAVFIYVVSRRFIPWRLPWHSLRNTAVASLALLVPYAAVFGLGWGSTLPLVVASVVGSAGYLGAIYLLGELQETELRKLKGMLGS
ncbi:MULTISPECIES: oligosaccharide flippase family protein [Halococcus]|uniref:Polysaccharide biosynthesis protein n=1 Tax=Halococcus salifodinae DSM 8989 TaxID=1227456 RepID=M0N8V8_9EURY|nr:MULTISPECIES: oligosaccharide flippase family protein [Halococcus]EMA53519.1 polysaccharide biosynthesis protein [Halococcus salifodinae DSM 8989]